VTSHSPELLDDPGISEEMLVAVAAEDGKTVAGRVDDATKSVLRDHLYTAGELLRVNQLRPDPDERKTHEQLRLFESGSAAS